MEHWASGFHFTHGFMADEGVWYHLDTGDVPLTFTSKADIARAIIELINIGLSDPSKLPTHVVGIAGSSKTPGEIYKMFNRKARKEILGLHLLTDDEARALISKNAFVPANEQMDEYDQEYMNDVASRVFLMTGGTGTLDFSKRNDSELVNPGESKWKWKSIEDYVCTPR